MSDDLAKRLLTMAEEEDRLAADNCPGIYGINGRLRRAADLRLAATAVSNPTPNHMTTMTDLQQTIDRAVIKSFSLTLDTLATAILELKQAEGP